MRLVDMMDNLLDVLSDYPEYIFHMDAQTIVLEDYLEIRPHKLDILKHHIKAGKLLVGPWYVQNDFYLTSGESTIRNLHIGRKIAENMGGCTRVGYMPDQFGLISQLPQLLNGFDIDNCIFSRGFTFYKHEAGELKPVIMPSEFYWQGEDSSCVLAVHLSSFYNNAQRFSEDIEKSLKLLEMVEKSFDSIAITPYLLLMNGVDHLEAQENLIPILEDLRSKLPESRSVKQTSMQEYINHLKQYISDNHLKDKMMTYTGELRNGLDESILHGTHSSRVYLKVENVKAQNMLECSLEPIFSMIHASGATGKYPDDYFHYLWKLLIKNHPHDSICGCSRDEVHAQMEDRFARLFEAGGFLLNRGMGFIIDHIERKEIAGNEYLLTVFNTVEGQRSGVIDIEMDFLEKDKVTGFKIVAPDGREASFTVISVRKDSRGIYDAINLPGFVSTDCWHIRLFAEDVYGPGYKTYRVIPAGAFADTAEKSMLPEQAAYKMENDYIRAVIGKDGAIDMLCKQTGTLYRDILCFEDSEDCGDSYTYKQADKGGILTSRGEKPEIKCLCDTGLETAYELDYRLLLPECYDDSTQKRSSQLVENRIKITLKLQKASLWLEIGIEINNASKDHRLRALVASGVNSDFTLASLPFDIIKRDRRDVFMGINAGTRPNSALIDIVGESGGISLLTEGLFEYEHLLDNKGTIAITLLRANKWIFRHVDENGTANKDWTAEGNQCLRTSTMRLAIYPHKGNYLDAASILRAKEFQNALVYNFCPADTKKYGGGRSAVQDSEIKEIFFRQDPYENVKYPMELRLFEIKNRDIAVSAIKKAYSDDSLMVRVYNTGDTETDFELSYFKPLAKVSVVSLDEKPVRNISFQGKRTETINIKPKEILTLSIL
jgi:Alpha-mannosidase